MLLDGSYYDDGQWLRPPLTSLMLAGIFAIVGVDIPRAMLVQVLLSAAILPLLAELARRVLASQRAGLVAALLAALFLPYASLASQLMSETLFIFMITLALLLFTIAQQQGMRWQWLFAGGVAWGLAALTRPVGVYALPLVFLWAIWQKLRSDDTHFRHALRTIWQQPTRYLLAPLALLIGFVVVVAPWTARNYAVYGHLVLVDTNGGISFWLGNLLEPEERELQHVWNTTIPNSAERQQVALQRAMDNIKQEPMLFLARLRYKTVSLWQLDTRLFAANAPIGITLDERSLPFAVASDIQYVFIMVLALVGLVLARFREISWTLIGWTLYGTLLSAVSLGHPRLRLPLMMAVFIYAALPLAHPRLVWQRLVQSSWLRYLGLVIGMGLVAFLFYASVYIPFGQSQYWLIQAKLNAGEPLPAIERAIAAAPDNYLPYVALGDYWRKQGNLEAALEGYTQAVERAPQNTPTHAWRLALLRRMGDTTAAMQAMQQIAALGWDNNQLYAWAWDRMPSSAGTTWDAAMLAPGVIRGFSPPARDKEHIYRWTKRHAQLRMGYPVQLNQPDQPTRLVLVMRADAPSTQVEVSWGGAVLTTVSVTPGWQRVVIPLGGSSSTTGQAGQAGEQVKHTLLELRTPVHVVSPAQPYPRGVALAEVTLAY